MRGDPAVLTAAVALSNGWADPLGLLALDAHDYDVAHAVVVEAEAIRGKRENAYLRASAEALAARVVYRLVRAFRKR